jgi:hypothetical protein
MDTTTQEKPERIEVKCSGCDAKIGEYVGPIGYNTPILSRYFIRTDGSRPKHGGSTALPCPSCKLVINELECTMLAIATALAISTAAATEIRGEGDTSPAPLSGGQDNDADSSDCCA